MKLKNMDRESAWTGGGILPPGMHDVTITEVEEGMSRNDKPMLTIQYEATDGQGIKEWMVVVPNTYGKVRALLDACKIEPEAGDWEFDPGVLVGKRLSIRVGKEEYQGDLKAKVQGYAFAGQAGSTVPADTEGLGAANSGPSRRDDDVPF